MNGDMDKVSLITRQTSCWVETVIVGLNFCPFAKHEVKRGSVHYQVSESADIEPALHDLITECRRLDENTDIETTLLIFADAFGDFDEYLDMLELANHLMAEQDYEGIYQLASFHPQYCFEGEAASDAANYTNRSPYPMLHLIREGSLEKVLENYPDPESIPERNIELARAKGSDEMKAILEKCRGLKE